MEIKGLDLQIDTNQDSNLRKSEAVFNKLLAELRDKNLDTGVIGLINQEVDKLNALSDSTKELRKQFHRSQSKITQTVIKKHKLVPNNYYRNIWMAIGLAAFGIPFGMLFATLMGNPAFFTLFMPVGLPIGMLVGILQDQQVQAEGRQINLAI